MYLCAVNNILANIMPKQEQKQSGSSICHVMHGMKNNNGGTPLMWQFGGGYVELNDNGTPTSWNYYVTDHLGSTRMVVDSNDSIKENINYYPFGSEMRLENPALLTGGFSHPFRFTGKELDKLNSLNMYDFGARLYDVAGVPMWTSVDPLAEKYYNISPYAYCANNPVKYIDIGGEWFWNSMGNLVVDKNDNYITLAEFLGTTESNAAFILGSVGLFPDTPEVYSVIPKESIYIIEAQKDGAVVNNTKEAVLHYFEGNGEAADVGNRSIFELIRTDEFIKNYNAIVTEGRESNEFAVDMTHKIFHIGKTGVSYIVHNGKVGKDSSSKVEFTLFVKDGFKDPLDMGIELPYGTPYDYKTRKVTYFFKPIQK